jgi:hypothetical protein
MSAAIMVLTRGVPQAVQTEPRQVEFGSALAELDEGPPGA